MSLDMILDGIYQVYLRDSQAIVGAMLFGNRRGFGYDDEMLISIEKGITQATLAAEYGEIFAILHRNFNSKDDEGRTPFLLESDFPPHLQLIFSKESGKEYSDVLAAFVKACDNLIESSRTFTYAKNQYDMIKGLSIGEITLDMAAGKAAEDAAGYSSNAQFFIGDIDDNGADDISPAISFRLYSNPELVINATDLVALTAGYKGGKTTFAGNATLNIANEMRIQDSAIIGIIENRSDFAGRSVADVIEMTRQDDYKISSEYLAYNPHVVTHALSLIRDGKRHERRAILYLSAEQPRHQIRDMLAIMLAGDLILQGTHLHDYMLSKGSYADELLRGMPIPEPDVRTGYFFIEDYHGTNAIAGYLEYKTYRRFKSDIASVFGIRAMAIQLARELLKTKYRNIAIFDNTKEGGRCNVIDNVPGLVNLVHANGFRPAVCVADYLQKFRGIKAGNNEASRLEYLNERIPEIGNTQQFAWIIPVQASNEGIDKSRKAIGSGRSYARGGTNIAAMLTDEISLWGSRKSVSEYDDEDDITIDTQTHFYYAQTVSRFGNIDIAERDEPINPLTRRFNPKFELVPALANFNKSSYVWR
jgi:hypothetical protein